MGRREQPRGVSPCGDTGVCFRNLDRMTKRQQVLGTLPTPTARTRGADVEAGMYACIAVECEGATLESPGRGYGSDAISKLDLWKSTRMILLLNTSFLGSYTYARPRRTQYTKYVGK